MRKHYYLYCLFFLTLARVSVAQNVQEDVYLHTNTSTIISGESVHYSAYVISKQTGKPSPLSQILYVELINEDGRVAHQSKVLLKNGRGSGDIFISSTYRTGAYLLIAYTRWMKNFETYFETPLVVINPFETIAISKEDTTEWSMDFQSAKAGIVSGIPNQIHYQVKGGMNFTGKVISEDGTQLVEFKPETHGMGSFEITPSDGQKLQAVLEDEDGQFYFFDLPKTQKQGSLFNVTIGNVALQLVVQSADENFEGTLLTQNNGDTIYQQLVVGGTQLPVPKRTFTPGLNVISLLDTEGEVVDQQMYYQETEMDDNEQEITKYARRQNVSIPNEIPSGSYSVSVKKANDWYRDLRSTSKNHFWLTRNIENYHLYPQLINGYDARVINLILAMAQPKTGINPTSIRFLPEFRGEMIEGRITQPDGKPIQETTIAYSNMGNNQLSFAKSDSLGNFLLNAFPVTEPTEANLSALNLTGYNLKMEDNFLSTKPAFNAPEVALDSLVIQEIAQASINSQIENAYFDVKKDIESNAKVFPESFSQYDFHYELDDYTRFKTLKETLIEYVLTVGSRTRKGKDVMIVRSQDPDNSVRRDPLILLDGIPVGNEEIMTFSPYRVKSIDIIANRVYYGPIVFDGVVSLETFNGDLHEFQLDESSLSFTMQGLEPRKNYTYPSYGQQDSNSRLPDRREQLFWNPQVEISDQQLTLDFTTSDLCGRYEISIEGFTSEGQPFSSRQMIEVE